MRQRQNWSVQGTNSITGGDEHGVRVVMATLEERWATSGIAPVRRDPGKPGVRARIYADVLRPGRDGP